MRVIDKRRGLMAYILLSQRQAHAPAHHSISPNARLRGRLLCGCAGAPCRPGVSIDQNDLAKTSSRQARDLGLGVPNDEKDHQCWINIPTRELPHTVERHIPHHALLLYDVVER